MFTGIIQEIGKVREVRNLGGGVRLTIEAPHSAEQLRVNDSIAINGVCQTVIERNASSFVVEAVEETLAKTTLGELAPDSSVNLELALQLSDRIGGHLVLGHVDCVGVIRQIVPRTNSWIIEIEIPQQYTKYLIPVGSIAVDGISLTVASIGGSTIGISVIPHTMQNTTLSSARAETRVNLEFDIIGKYVERLTLMSRGEASLTRDKLREWGYDE